MTANDGVMPSELKLAIFDIIPSLILEETGFPFKIKVSKRIMNLETLYQKFCLL